MLIWFPSINLPKKKPPDKITSINKEKNIINSKNQIETFTFLLYRVSFTLNIEIFYFFAIKFQLLGINQFFPKQ